jgi:serine protease Do
MLRPMKRRTFLVAAPSLAAAQPATDLEARSRALERAANAVVGVQVLALEDARSNATLGRARQGSGVVIGDDGLVLTIGYLVLEAEQVRLLLDDGRSFPARVVAYDLATGFGLLMPLAPLKLPAVPLGAARAVAADDALLVVSGAPAGMISDARLVSRRAFAGYWEYRIEGALFTAPPRTDHSGAGLFNPKGELVGIGSLVVADAAESSGAAGARRPGNMFVPIDLLPPILGELRTHGASAASRRAWLGVNAVEQGRELRVVRVAEDGPAQAAGVRVGDRIVSLDGQAVDTLDALWTRLWAGGGPERTIRLDIQRGNERLTFEVRSVDRAANLRRATGV